MNFAETPIQSIHCKNQVFKSGQKPEIADITEPDAELAGLFAPQRERFKALYGALKPEFRK